MNHNQGLPDGLAQFAENRIISSKLQSYRLILNACFIFAGGLMINISAVKTTIIIVGITNIKKLASG